MRVQFSQWGNSLAVRIPSTAAHEIHAFAGRPADLTVRDGRLVVEPLDQVPTYDLETLLAAITPENVHGETATGFTVGAECIGD